ncbi:MAG: hypothetical protein Gyms2KO_40420 [Gymnodinialimonas sp.]
MAGTGEALIGRRALAHRGHKALGQPLNFGEVCVHSGKGFRAVGGCCLRVNFFVGLIWHLDFPGSMLHLHNDYVYGDQGEAVHATK